jgi:hypothetical protein
MGMMNDIETKCIRLQRLIGLDETKGVRGDLARARAAAARGYQTAPNGKPIGEAIASLESALEIYRARLAELDQEA